MSIVNPIRPSMAGAYVFPSSSANGKAKALTESNLRQITNRIVTRNYKLAYEDFTVSSGGDSYLQVSGGIAIINGYRVVLPSVSQLSITGLEDDVTYDISLKLSKQTSADTYIINNTDADVGDDDNTTGAIYFQYDQSVDIQKTINDVIASQENGIKYRPAVYRKFSDDDLYKITENISDDTTEIDYSGTNYCSSSIWNFNKLDGLFVNKWHDTRLASLDLDKSDENAQDLALVIGWVKVNNGTIVDTGTYNCLKRIDADDIFVGETTLDDYLVTSGTFVKTYGGNVISAIRNENEEIQTGFDGKVLIPFVSTADTKRYGSSEIALTDIGEFNSSKDYVAGDYVYFNKIVDNTTVKVLLKAKREYNHENPEDALTDNDIVPIGNNQYKSNNVFWEVDNNITEFTDEDVNYTTGDIVYKVNTINSVDYLNLYQKNSTAFPESGGTIEIIDPEDDATNTYWTVYAILVTRMDNKYIYAPYTYAGESYVPVGTEQENGNNDVQKIKSIIECSFNSINAEDNVTSSNDTEVVDSIRTDILNGAQILSVTSMDECYTSYTYGVIRTELYDESDAYDYKYMYSQCAANKFFIGFNSPSQKTAYIDIDETYDENKTYSLGNLVKYYGKVYKFISTVSASGVLPIDTDYWKEESPQFGEFGIYDDDNTNHIWIQPVYDSQSGTLGKEIDIKGNIININNGNRDTHNLKIQSDKVTYEVYDDTTATGEPVSSEVGFSTYVTETSANNNNTDVSAIRFYRDDILSGIKESYIYLEPDTDTNDKPKLGISSSLMVRGYVRADRVYNAVYNDYAEWYNSTKATEIKEGDIIYYNPDTDEYSNTSENPQTVVGICTEDYGMIVGGDNISNMENNRENYIPVSLCGRVKVKVNPQHTYKCGDYIYADGTNIGNNQGTNMVGKFLKYCDNKEYALVQVCLS